MTDPWDWSIYLHYIREKMATFKGKCRYIFPTWIFLAFYHGWKKLAQLSPNLVLEVAKKV